MSKEDSKEKKKKKKESSSTWTPDKNDSPQKLSLSKLKTLGSFTTKVISLMIMIELTN